MDVTDANESINQDFGVDFDEINSIKSMLSENPHDYSLHVKLINALKVKGSVEDTRIARQHMSDVYPLSPELWLEWIKDEQKIAHSDDEKREIENLFKRAVEDYEDVNVWLEYCYFKMANMNLDTNESPGQTVSEVETIFELALSHQGLNVASGTLLWDSYKELQYLILAYMMKNNQDAVQDRIKKIDNLFHRQLRIPLLNMQQTYTEYETFISGPGKNLYPINEENDSLVPSDIKKEYEKALEKLSVLLPFEEALEDAIDESESDHFHAWETYLKWAVNMSTKTKSKCRKNDSNNRTTTTVTDSGSANVCLSPNEICCLFERAITAHCLYPSIWLQFADYIEFNLSSDTQRLLQLFARSVRNCPWSVDLWVRYALTAEFIKFSNSNNGSINGQSDGIHSTELDYFKSVAAIYETALSVGLENSDDILRIWVSYCDHQVRRLCSLESNSTEWTSRLAVLRETFDRAINFSLEMFVINPQFDWSIFKYYSFVEAKYAHDLERARTIWSQLMRVSGHGSQACFWIEYINFEQYFGDVKHLLRVCGMAINSVSLEFADTLFNSVIQSLNQSGLSILHLRDFHAKLHNRRTHLKELALNVETKSKEFSGKISGNKTNKQKVKNQLMEETSKEQSQDIKKRKHEVENNNQTTISSIKPTKRPKLDEEQKSDACAHGVSITHDPTKNDVTVFVSNLSYSTTEEQLTETFKNCGELKSVRLVRNYAGRSKGFAYVEFENSQSVQNALKLDRKPVVCTLSDSSSESQDKQSPLVGQHLRPMFVSVCDPNRPKSSVFQYSIGKKEPEKLFVRNLTKNVTTDELENLFKQYGNVISVRLATYRNGIPKGHAYIEFDSANSASRALVATNGMTFHDKCLSVEISEPPVRSNNSQKNPQVHAVEKTSTNSFAIPTRPPNIRNNPRTHLDFQPRSLRHPTAISKTTKDEANGNLENQTQLQSSTTTPQIQAQQQTSEKNEDNCVKDNQYFRKFIS